MVSKVAPNYWYKTPSGLKTKHQLFDHKFLIEPKFSDLPSPTWVNTRCLDPVLYLSPLKILRSRVFHLYSSLILIGLLGNFWLKTVFVLE